MKPLDQLNPWELLGLAPGATAEEINRAYECLSSRLVPGSLSLYSIADREEQLDLQQRLRAAYLELLAGVRPGELLSDSGTPEAPPTLRPNEEAAAASGPLSDGTTGVQLPGAAAETGFNGDLLRRHRETRNLSLETLSHRTRIRRQLLESLEAERFEALPERVFVRGFVLAVARELGLDPESVWAGYGKRWEAWAAGKR